MKAKMQQKSQTKAKSDVECSVCQFAVGQLETYISSTSTEAEIEQYLNQICSMVGPFQSQCMQVVQDVPQYVDLLIKNENPLLVCTQVGACSSPVGKH